MKTAKAFNFPRRSLPRQVKIVEVGLRDGLQNESKIVPTEAKLHLLRLLYKAGLRNIEAGAFVSPKWVPQMADSDKIYQYIQQHSADELAGCAFPALVPNAKGFQTAIENGVKEIAIFAAASETFSKKNINCTIDESLERYKEVCNLALQKNIRVRGYVSCVLGCPYEGVVPPAATLYLTQKLLDLGCYEVSLGDTIGTGSTGSVSRLLEVIMPKVSRDHLAVHFHDTYGQALANIFVALEHGIRTVDSSISGLGGCPYAKGASGNVATEDLVYMLTGLGITHGVNLTALVEGAVHIDNILGKTSASKASLVWRTRKVNTDTTESTEM